MTDFDDLSLVFLLVKDHVENGLVAVMVDLLAPFATIIVRLWTVTERLYNCFGAGEQCSHVSDGTYDETRIQKCLASGRQ